MPKGRIEAGEDPIKIANKELQEEMGFKARKLHKLGILTMSPGYLTQRTYIFLAEDLVESKLEGDEEEPIQILKIPFNQFEKFIDEGKLTEARMIAALYMARKYLENRNK